MERFTTISGVAAPMLEDDVNTDDITPGHRLRSPGADLAKALFADRRYLTGDVENDAFILNREPYRASRVLVAGSNFGCGSSREMAVWALMRFGIGCVIAQSFSDIFAENAFKNGLLLIELVDEMVVLKKWLEHHPAHPLTVDLAAQAISGEHGLRIGFAISDFKRTALLEGLDEIGRTLRFEADITEFQTRMAVDRPWAVRPTDRPFH